MKVLIYGSGVVGSYLAYTLSEAQHEVTMLARGKRVEELKDGLKIKHILQYRETTSYVKVVEKLGEEDYYDIIFVVMQAQQFQETYTPLIKNKHCPLIIFIGNNADPQASYSTLIEKSKIKREVLFAFLSVGGRKEKGKIISLHEKRPKIHVGTVTQGIGSNKRSLIDTLFEELTLNYRWYDNMDGYLRAHIAIIIPLAYLAYISNFKLHRFFFKSSYLKAAVWAMREGLTSLEKIGKNPVIPQELVSIFKNKVKEFFFMRTIILPPIGRLAICDHCRASKCEVDFLEQAMLKWLNEAKIKHTNYDFLLEKLGKNWVL